MLREKGNAMFRSGAFEEALLLYGAALAAEDAAEPTPPAVRATLLGNRSACNLNLQRFGDAVEDAREALVCDPSGEKNHYRLIMALRGLGEGEEANSVLQQALVQFPDASVFAKLQHKQQQQQHVKKKKPPPPPKDEVEIVGAMLIETVPTEGCCAEEIAMRSETRRLIRRLQQQSSGAVQLEHQLAGTFKQLSTRQSMVDALFPGVPGPQLAQLPQSLREVLLWRELILDVSKIAKSAWSVFAEVRRKAALAGDAMDRDAQSVMGAQVVQEALAREVVLSVRRLAKQMSHVSARVSLSLASPESDKARQDQLLTSTVLQLVAADISCQDEYLGGDWAALIASDVVRFVAHERMTPVGQTQQGPGSSSSSSASCMLPSMAYVDLDAGLLEESYPALAEAVAQLHSLPHELNLKSGGRLRLLEAGKGCTMIHRFPAGAQQPARLDNTENSPSDSGIRLTCSYHLCAPPEAGTATLPDLPSQSPNPSQSPAKFGHCPAASSALEMQYLNIRNDWLVLHQSTRVRNERQSASREYFVITFMVHQQHDTAEEGDPGASEGDS